MKMMLSLILAALFSACESVPVQSVPASKISEMSSFVRDDFKKVSGVFGPKVTIPSQSQLSGMPSMDQWQLSAEKDDGDSGPRYFINFRIVAGRVDGWSFLKEGFDLGGRKFPLVKTSSNVDGGLTFELFLAAVDRSYLDEAARLPVTWRLYGRRQIDVSFQPNVVDGFLRKVDAALH